MDVLYSESGFKSARVSYVDHKILLYGSIIFRKQCQRCLIELLRTLPSQNNVLGYLGTAEENGAFSYAIP